MTKQYLARGSMRGPAGPQGPAGTDASAIRVLYPRVGLAYAATVTPDASAGNYRYCQLAGNLNLDTPTNPSEDQLLRIRFASTVARTITFSATYKRSVGVLAQPTCPANGCLDVMMLYDSSFGWTILVANAVS